MANKKFTTKFHKITKTEALDRDLGHQHPKQRLHTPHILLQATRSEPNLRDHEDSRQRFTILEQNVEIPMKQQHYGPGEFPGGRPLVFRRKQAVFRPEKGVYTLVFV